jgi:leucyl aminopeptidase
MAKVPGFATNPDNAIPLHFIAPDIWEAFLAGEGAAAKAWAETTGFKPMIGKALLVPNAKGLPQMAIVGRGTESQRRRTRFALAAGFSQLSAGTYRLACPLPDDEAEAETLGCLLAGYAFDRYRAQSGCPARLLVPEGLDATRVEILAAGEALTRDLINTPTSDMGPADLQNAAEILARTHGAACSTIIGDDLLAQNFPMIHAVGRAAAPENAPRLIELRWGDAGPTLTLVGKGVCFDTGGLDIKPAASMGLMKKDMGGAATVLGLAHILMALKLPLRLRVLIPAVENSISGNAFRPQDILTSRKGLTVEINNTDAEGRLVLADALAYGAEDAPNMMLSMATLTGAARVAVGPDLAPFFTDDDQVAHALSAAAPQMADPVWRLPFWEPYEADIEPGIADLDNAPKGGFGGAITAALFLRRFTEGAGRYTHFDIYGWQPSPAPARSKGGTMQGARAILGALPKILGL